MEDTQPNNEIVDVIGYIREEYERIIREDVNRADVLRLDQGENIVTIFMNEPWRRVNTKYGERVAIPVFDKRGEKKVLLVGQKSRLYKAIIKALAESVKKNEGELESVVLSIYKVGSGLKASYDVKVVEEHWRKKEGKRK
ncbi:MAG: hypothetical protein JHC26_11550 [Thermofilum sp.]|jgi:hypothetical protein|uniref:hypothetical protein n=1 Tax=Thermofilum sp. TaxID=1961369 RepID=UPI00258D9AF8|nr:hypothetical protein [Thermofilum sp.]MCI4409717.1 hypothetical protein [Thermofilum sp.]